MARCSKRRTATKRSSRRSPWQLQTEWDTAEDAGQNWGIGSLEAKNGATTNWTGALLGYADAAAEDYTAGAYAMCCIDGQIEYAFDYEAADVDVDDTTVEDDDSTGSLGNVLGSLGSYNDEEVTDPA